MNCRHCHAPLTEVFADLGTAPPSNAFVQAADLDAPEIHFPLKAWCCGTCRLVQIGEVQRHDALFSSDYVYFSSYSRSWLDHARAYVAQAVDRLALGSRSLVLEIASNDGYLLQYMQERGIACAGIEPTASTAAAARAKGIESIEAFFGEVFATDFARTRRRADLVIGNNVLAHVPDINDFVAGLKAVLAPGGSVTMEFPHLLNLVREAQFDTIYHEHFSYLGFTTVQRILASAGLEIWDVERLPTHGGSLRIWAQHSNEGLRDVLPAVAGMLAEEIAAGMDGPAFYASLQPRAEGIRNRLTAWLIEQKSAGRRVVAYGAAAKGNTLLNWAGIRADLLPYVVDASPHKQGRFLPGSRIPVVDEAMLRQTRPDYVLILPWNLRSEISTQLAYIAEWGGRCIVAVPTLEIL
ncbi:MAG: class I SAM-dependent methyltransferase [Burkholderiales bacterium]|nr:class I SAM-dependent methyltransferase [Burkholderiales bacterium]